ncbi:MAG TPA: hypothetical protein VK738_09560 [Terriglobales bacterium]|jgi:hypothetical protein|nr:hypothetical protein [Terriglobales bacterium]
MKRFPDYEQLGFLLKKDKGPLSAEEEEEAWIQKYLDLADKLLKPEPHVIFRRIKAKRS